MSMTSEGLLEANRAQATRPGLGPWLILLLLHCFIWIPASHFYYSRDYLLSQHTTLDALTVPQMHFLLLQCLSAVLPVLSGLVLWRWRDWRAVLLMIISLLLVYPLYLLAYRSLGGPLGISWPTIFAYLVTPLGWIAYLQESSVVAARFPGRNPRRANGWSSLRSYLPEFEPWGPWLALMCLLIAVIYPASVLSTLLKDASLTEVLQDPQLDYERRGIIILVLGYPIKIVAVGLLFCWRRHMAVILALIAIWLPLLIGIAIDSYHPWSWWSAGGFWQILADYAPFFFVAGAWTGYLLESPDIATLYPRSGKLPVTADLF